MLSAYTSVLKLEGEDSFIFQSADDIIEWAKENEQILSNNTTHFDKALPTKTEKWNRQRLQQLLQNGKICSPKPSLAEYRRLQNKAPHKSTLNPPPRNLYKA